MDKEIFLQSLKRHDGELFGRDKEIQELQELFQQVVEEKKARAVFLHGYSGTGKSLLAHYALGSSNKHKKPNVQFAEGKYDQQRSSRPYAAFTDACRMLCESLVRIPGQGELKEPKRLMVESLEKALAKDFQLLSSLIPEAVKLLPNCNKGTQDQEQVSGTFQFVRLKAALKMFLVSISQHIPVVLFIDDLQWADAASMDIFETLLTEEEDNQLATLFFVGAYRDNELAGSHPLRNAMDNLEDKARSRRMHVADLTLEHLNHFVATLLKYEDNLEHTMALSKSIHQRTRGNIFFILQFLELLVSSEILSYSFVTMKWEWDASKLQEQTEATENVTDLVIVRMKRLDPDTALALIIASQLGNRFDANVVCVVLRKWKESADESAWSASKFDLMNRRDNQDDQKYDLSLLDIPMREGFIVPVGESYGASWYRFLHDRIQQAASGLISNEKQRNSLRLRLGQLLLDIDKRMFANRKSWVVLSAVDILNTVVELVVSKEQRLDLAKANMKAARIAAAQSAFVVAAEYLTTSRSLLDEDQQWAELYDITLAIYTLSAEMEFCCGNSVECLKLCDTVKQHRKQARDSWQVSYIAMKSLGSEAKYTESIDLAYEVLNEAGFHVPTNGVSPDDVGAVYTKVAQELGKRTNESILALPDEPADEASRLIWKICSSSALFVWHANRLLDHTYICCSMTLRTLEKGLSSFSGQSFALQCISCMVNGDFALVKRLYKLWSNSDIVRRFTGQEVEAGTLAAANAASGHVCCPLTVVADGFMKGYESGMKTGSIEWAMTDSGCYLLTHYMSGLPLTLFEADAWVFIKEMKKYGNKIHKPMCEMYLQCALNLMGKASGPSHLLEGDATIEYDMSAILSGSNPDEEFPVHTALFAQLMLSYYFNDYETAADLAVKHEAAGGLDWPLLWSVPQPFFRGLAYAAKVRLLEASKRATCCGWFSMRQEIHSYLDKARNQLATLKHYAENGMINSAHMFKILQAEVASVTPGSKPDDVINIYKEAIRSASRSGFRQDAALASERAAIYMIDTNMDEAAINDHVKTAIELYEKWGAVAKASDMKLEFHSADLKNFRRSGVVREGYSRRVSNTSASSDRLERRVTLTADICQGSDLF